MAGKQIGQLRSTGIPRLCLQKLSEDFGCSGHIGNADLNSFFFSDRVVEFIDQKVHGSICLFTVNVPDGQCSGIVGIQQSFSAARILTSGECQKGERCK